MNKNILYIIIAAVVIIVIGGLAWYFLYENTIVIESDLNIEGDYAIEDGSKVILKNGAKLIVGGNLDVSGRLICENGDINVSVDGDVNIQNDIMCERDNIADDQEEMGISIIAKGSLTTGNEAEIVTTGNVQIVEKAEDLATTQEQIDEIFEDIGQDTGDGNRLGPFIDEELISQGDILIGEHAQVSSNSTPLLVEAGIIKTAHAQARRVYNLHNGAIIVNPQIKKKKRIIILNLPGIDEVSIQNFAIFGPDANSGDDDTDKCTVNGKDGDNAMRFTALAPNIRINNFALHMGSGGDGGNAVTKKDDCDHGKATGGNGGKAGNIKMVTSQGFNIEGKFIIHPGWGGNGGDAFAYGKEGDPGEKGGDATANGGHGADNKKAIRARGNINGVGNIEVGSMLGGHGGSAYAFPGKGGDGVACKSQTGGAGGDGTAIGGDGGDAKLILSGKGAGRITGAEDIAGDGGDAEVRGGQGGNGSQCDPKKAGGNGGKGGNVINAAAGNGSIGDKIGAAGTINNQAGGNGGNGGDGCLPGDGGEGGNGDPQGEKGKDGKNVCPPINITVKPTNLSFEHQIGGSPCPQLIGDISISGDAASWEVANIPPWMSITKSGAVPGTATAKFNCVLSSYVTQTVNGSLEFSFKDKAGKPVGNPMKVDVSGFIQE